jgi:Protein of unknown function (DUF3108)
MRRTLQAAIVYAIAACLFTWPLVLRLDSVLAGEASSPDPSLNLWVLGWDLHVFSTHPSWIFTGRVFNASIFHPAPHTLAYSDHLLLQAFALWPVYALTDNNLVFCFNLLLIVSLVASALAMHALAWKLTGSGRAAYVAGLIFGFAPYHFTHLIHIQLQALYFLPLSFVFLHRLFDEQRAADTVALGLVLGLQAVSSIYYGVIGGVGIACAALLLIVLNRRFLDWRLMRRLVVAAAISLAVVLPVAIPYALVQREAGAGRTLSEAASNSAVLRSYLQVPVMNVVYGRTGVFRPEAGSRSDGPEQALFPGFCAVLLAVLGSIVAPPGSRRIAATYAALALIGIVLSLGPNGVRPVYNALSSALFGMAAIRAPARFSVLTLCGIAVLAALAIKSLEIRRERGGPLVAIALLVIALEYTNGTIAYPPPPRLTSDAGRWLRDQPGSGAVICVPLGLFSDNTPCMLQSLEHGRPVVNGYSGLRPLFFEALVDVLSRLPDPESLLALRDLGVEYVVSDRLLTIQDAISGALVERVGFADQYVYQLAWSGEIETKIRSITDVPPPEPGPASFVAGESASYQVRWTNGPLDLPAGEASISVAAPQGAEAFRFVVEAKTAPWVSRFYEALVSLETTANPRLLPLGYHEIIDEGKRRIDRRLEFDFARHEVRIASGGTTISLPLGAEARDPLTALFYIRTQPLSPGARFALPITDVGRRLTLDVSVAGRETIQLNGREWAAWKLAPQLSNRIERSSLTIAAWVSDDEHRVPLLVEVAAGFGSVRVELTSYRDR